jgi:hypothetical protein
VWICIIYNNASLENLFQNSVSFEEALGKIGLKPGFSSKFKVALSKLKF